MQVSECDNDIRCEGLSPLEIENIDKLRSFLEKREIYSCEFDMTTLFMWKSRNNPHVYYDDHFCVLFGLYKGNFYAQMPLCEPAYFEESFEAIKSVFARHDDPVSLFSVDQEYADFVKERYGDTYEITYNRKFSDYLYEADRLRELPGKKLRKKRNHINAFLRENEGRFEYRELTVEDLADIEDVLALWLDSQETESSRIDDEMEGILYIIKHMERLQAKAGGIYIDGKLEGFTVGSTINHGTEAIIHVEKANAEIRGLYPYLGQQFLVQTYPEVTLVNREDDIGLPGLRKSKESYEPIRLEHKYMVHEKMEE